MDMTQGENNTAIPNNVHADDDDDYHDSKESLASNDYIDAMNNAVPLSEKPLLSTDDNGEEEFGSSDYIDAANKDNVFSSPKGETYVPPPNK